MRLPFLANKRFRGIYPALASFKPKGLRGQTGYRREYLDITAPCHKRHQRFYANDKFYLLSGINPLRKNMSRLRDYVNNHAVNRHLPEAYFAPRMLPMQPCNWDPVGPRKMCQCRAATRFQDEQHARVISPARNPSATEHLFNQLH